MGLAWREATAGTLGTKGPLARARVHQITESVEYAEVWAKVLIFSEPEIEPSEKYGIPVLMESRKPFYSNSPLLVTQGDSGLFKALRAEVSAEWTAASSKRGSCRPRWVARVASRVDRTGGFDAGFRIEGFGLPARKLGGGADDVKHKNSTETMSDALDVTSAACGSECTSGADTDAVDETMAPSISRGPLLALPTAHLPRPPHMKSATLP